MTRIENIFFTLLRSGLSGERATLVEYVPISDKEWQEVYDLFNDQGLVGIGFTAIELLDKSQLPDMDTLMDWLGQTEYIKTENEEYRKNSEEFLSKVRGEGLEVRVLKGMECSKYYPVPERRALGDLDIFILHGNYEKGNEIAKELGAKVDLHDYKHSHITWKGLTVENHRLLTTARGSKVKKEFEKYLQSIIPSKQFEALFLMIHASQHFLIEGLSLRQICDWAMFLKCCHEEVDWDDFYLWMYKLKIIRFANALNAIAVDKLLGCDCPAGVRRDSVLGDMIVEDVMKPENHCDFGNVHGMRYHWLQLKKYRKNNWKYREVYGSNAFVEYMKTLWYYVTERNPKI